MTGIKEAKAVVLEVGESGDLIYQVATSFARWERNGEEGSYLCDCMYVWRKEADGTYRVFLDALQLGVRSSRHGVATPTVAGTS